MEKEVVSANTGKKKSRIYIPLIVFVLAVMGGVGYWYSNYKKYISTDDAHIDADNLSISSKILGRIIKIYADEGDTIKEGALLVELDSNDLLAQRKQAMALEEQSVTTQAQAEAKLNYDKENIKVLEVNVNKTLEDFERAKAQKAGDVITQEQFDHIKKAYETAQAQFDAAQAQLNVSKAQIESAAAAIESSKAQVHIVETQLKNTKIYAPFDGIIARRWLLPGDVVQPGQAVFTLTNYKKLWLIVYIEETKLSYIHLDQAVRYTIDAFPGVTFLGKVYYIGSNTASQFSLIPPNNASGNFTKVTQRVPLKVSIDGTDDKGAVSSYKIIAGMSAEVKIIKE